MGPSGPFFLIYWRHFWSLGGRIFLVNNLTKRGYFQ